MNWHKGICLGGPLEGEVHESPGDSFESETFVVPSADHECDYKTYCTYNYREIGASMLGNHTKPIGLWVASPLTKYTDYGIFLKIIERLSQLAKEKKQDVELDAREVISP